MTTDTAPITWEELLSNCFSPKTLTQAHVGRFRKDGPYMIRLSWDREGLPLNQQIIWLLYHPRSMKPVEKILDSLGNTARLAEGHHTLIIDDYNPETHWAHTILMLSDGAFTYNTCTMEMNDGSKGHIGWIVGQGRDLACDDDTTGALHVIIANIIPAMKPRHRNSDPFLLNGQKKLGKMKEVMNREGFRWSENTVVELRGRDSLAEGNVDKEAKAK
ncbi:MAG: hypothetical protein ABIJ47_10835 [Candidatus Bathyarchaeota archaeon]